MATDTTTTPEVASILGVIDTHLRWRSENQINDRSYKRYHPSEWGKCLRRQQLKHYLELGHPVQYDKSKLIHRSQQIRLFHKGHNMHHRWQDWYMADIGIARGRWQCENPICYLFADDGEYDPKNEDGLAKSAAGKRRIYGEGEKLGIFRPKKCLCGCEQLKYRELPVIDESLNFGGSCDMIIDFSQFDPSKYGKTRKTFNVSLLPKHPVIIDFKSMRAEKFAKLGEAGPSREYVLQITIYCHVLDVPFGLIMYENKNDSGLRPFKVEKNDAIFETVVFQAKAMKAAAPLQLLPPPRPLEKSDYECKGCEFQKFCHSHEIWDAPDLEERRRAFYRNLL